MAKVLIINTPLFKEKMAQHDEDSLPPIGLGYIATNLKMLGHDVRLIDAVANNNTVSELLDMIGEFHPDVVAVNIFTTNYNLTKELIESIKDPSIKVIVGGLSTRTLYKDIFKWETKNHIDVVFGDGELITGELISGTESELPKESTAFRRFFYVNCESIYFVKDISTVPLDRSFFINEPLINHSGFKEVSIVTNRGCKNNCTFCAAARSRNSDLPIREMTEESVARDIEDIRKRYKDVTHIRVLDDLFLGNSQSVDKAARIFSHFNFKWRAMAHIQTFNGISYDKIKALYDSGCRELFIGVESGSPKILKKIHKTHDIAIIKNSLGSIMDAGIGLKIYFVYGFPQEKREDFEQTYQLAIDLKNLAIKKGVALRTSVFQFRPYHGTEIYDELVSANKDFDAKAIHSNNELSSSAERAQFNFTSGNYSAEDECIVREFINKTMSLGEEN
jgi:radical SAM superfamily enzyme YgiQ (UPF0313 family)